LIGRRSRGTEKRPQQIVRRSARLRSQQQVELEYIGLKPALASPSARAPAKKVYAQSLIF